MIALVVSSWARHYIVYVTLSRFRGSFAISFFYVLLPPSFSLFCSVRFP